MTDEGTHVSYADLKQSLECPPFQGAALTAFAVEATQRAFVEPAFVAKLSTVGAPITLISARGATGKSRLAEEFSREFQVPIWKLQEDQTVGPTSLGYKLTQYAGSHDLREILLARPMVIIDALDEARSRVSSQSWAEFLHSISEAALDGCRFILLGREHTLEDAWFSLSVDSVEVAWVEISHFQAEQRRQYVNNAVSARTMGADTSTYTYIEARDAVLSSLSGTVSGEASEPFVGYAPVLDAVAALLIGANFFRVKQDFSSGYPVGPRMAVLEAILKQLLERDQQKLSTMAAENALPAETFSPAEQLDWLCHLIEGAPEPSLSYIADEALRQRYRELVRPFVEDHPFASELRWASPVFAAYVAAQRFDGGAIPKQSLISIANKSGLLFDFMSLSDDRRVVDEWQFAALHASALASEWEEATASVGLASAGGGSLGYEGAMIVLARDDVRSIDFSLIPDSDTTLNLRGPLTSLSVDVNGSVLLTSNRPDLLLGPDLFIHATTVRVNAEQVEFAKPRRGGGEGEPSVVLEAETDLVVDAGIAIPPTQQAFEIRVPGSATLTYPWITYRQTLEPPDAEPDARAVRFLNMFMNLTRAHGHAGERGVFNKKLEGRQSYKASVFGAAIEVLVRHGVARVDGDMIYMQASWETHRFSGKTLPGRRLLVDVRPQWDAVLTDLALLI